jgi:hypothetical protein
MKRRVLALLAALAIPLAATPAPVLAGTYEPPRLTKEFGAQQVAVGYATSLTFHLTNPNTLYKMLDVHFTDDLPAGLTIGLLGGATGTCLTYPGASVSAPAGGHTISLSGLMFDGTKPNTCEFTVAVVGAAPGLQQNKTDAVFGSVDGLLKGDPASANIVVIGPPVTTVVFDPGTIYEGGASNGTITISNAAGNTVPLTGIGFDATLPSGLTVRSEVNPWCGGTLTLTAPNRVSLSGATVANGLPCVIAMNFRGMAPRTYTLTTGSVTSSNGGPGMGGTGALNVLAVAHPTGATASGTAGSAPSAGASAGASESPSASGSIGPSAAASGEPGGTAGSGGGDSSGLVLGIVGAVVALAVVFGLVMFARQRRHE